jgi:hypothetical protein
VGVLGTWCQICGIPVQQDHYVELDGMFGIYRGGESHEVCAPALPFAEEHEWLKDAVALRLSDAQDPVILEGRIHDGAVEKIDGDSYDDGMVMDGIEERAALHRACWELAGRPDSWDKLGPRRKQEGLEIYQEQLFEFAGLVKDGKGWMLVDPRSDSDEARRNRVRIEALLKP